MGSKEWNGKTGMEGRILIYLLLNEGEGTGETERKREKNIVSRNTTYIPILSIYLNYYLRYTELT